MGNEIKPNIFISYSSKDTEIADKLYSAIEQLDLFDIKYDKKDINVADVIPEKIRNYIENSNIFILLLSNSSIDSDWVKYEAELAFEKYHGCWFLFVPLLIEEIHISSQLIHQINEYKINTAQFEFPDSIEKEFESLIDALSKIFRFSYDKHKLINVMADLGKQVNSDLVRYKKIIDNVISNRLQEKLQKVEERIENIYQLTYLKSKVLTLNDILDIERTAEYDVWIVTTHLKNDEDMLFSTVIDENINKGVIYTYFYPPGTALERRIAKYIKTHGEKKVNFIPLSTKDFFPYDEVAIYNPLDIEDIVGYIQLSYEKGIFIELEKHKLLDIVSKLELHIPNNTFQIE